MIFKKIWKAISSEYIPSAICFFLLAKMDYEIISIWPQNASVDDRIKLSLLFIHLVMILVMFTPLINRFLSRVDNEKLEKFIALPQKDKNITYIDYYDFLSGLALSAFYLSILIFTMKSIYEEAGWIISGIYIFTMFVSSISIAALSLLRFIWLFTKFNNYIYWFIVLLASSMCMAVIGAAMKMAS
ncbi:hypothetical protein ACM6O4_19335 [Citrobacter portucalensis]|uniref:hypothetical protein n=1 Tax=Citrobacter portucalensis TaxID=1639133 RepID=UPI001E5DBC0A|nr:hypothetical protein [Citrobacter portucalensis]MCR3702296.1 hypothetical protein [Citrobacter portucalensis]